MKKMFLLIWLCVFLAAAPLSGAEPPKPEAMIGPEAAPVAVREGQTFALTLGSNPTTGYIWQLAEPLNEGIVRFISQEYRMDKTDRVGAGGLEIWTFKAVGSGETRINMKYVRPWEKDTTPADTAQFKIISSGEMKK